MSTKDIETTARDLRRMKEEVEAEISSRIDTAALKKALPEIAERLQTTPRRFCVR